MTFRTALIAALVATALAACSKSSSTSGTATGSAAATGSATVAHAALPAEVDAFHELLAPLWHSAQGDARRDATCAALPQLHDAATAVANAKPPAIPDPQPWAIAVVHLSAAVDALKEPCDRKDTAAFDTAFHEVHENFHAVMAAGGGEHGEHEHMHGDTHGDTHGDVHHDEQPK